MKNWKIAALALLGALALSACGRQESRAVESGTEAAQAVELTFWSPTWHKDADEQVIAAFEAQNPDIDIVPSYYSSDDIKTNLKVAASSNTLPDMWYMWGGGNYANYYAKSDLCYDLTAYAQEHGWTDKYIPSALELCTYDGRIIALPQVYTGLVMWYRTDIFAEYGLKPPATMEELDAICATLKENGVTPFSTGAKHIYRYGEALLEHYAGAQGHDELNALEADWSQSEAVAQAFAHLKRWGDAGYFQEGFITDDGANAKMYVFSGSTAMVIDNSGMASDVVANGYDSSLYSFFPLPVGRVSAYVKVSQFNKNLSPEKLEAAMRFWDYYYSQESLDAHDSIEQPTAIAGAKLSEAMSLADGMLEAIDGAGSYTTTDLHVPSQVMDVIFASGEAVMLGEMAPEDLGKAVEAAAKTYRAANP